MFHLLTPNFLVHLSVWKLKFKQIKFNNNFFVKILIRPIQAILGNTSTSHVKISMTTKCSQQSKALYYGTYRNNISSKLLYFQKLSVCPESFTVIFYYVCNDF